MGRWALNSILKVCIYRIMYLRNVLSDCGSPHVVGIGNADQVNKVPFLCWSEISAQSHSVWEDLSLSFRDSLGFGVSAHRP